jgi:hypothetical protein
MLLYVQINSSHIEVYNNYKPRHVEASYSIGTAELSSGLRRPGHEADQALCKAKLRNEWSQTSLPPVPSANRQLYLFC